MIWVTKRFGLTLRDWFSMNENWIILRFFEYFCIVTSLITSLLKFNTYKKISFCCNFCGILKRDVLDRNKNVRSLQPQTCFKYSLQLVEIVNLNKTRAVSSWYRPGAKNIQNMTTTEEGYDWQLISHESKAEQFFCRKFSILLVHLFMIFLLNVFIKYGDLYEWICLSSNLLKSLMSKEVNLQWHKKIRKRREREIWAKSIRTFFCVSLHSQ